jgi:HEAT repeat protein
MEEFNLTDEEKKVLDNTYKGFVRSGAAYSLGQLGDKRAVEPLNKALEDKSSFVKKVAGVSLKKIQ